MSFGVTTDNRMTTLEVAVLNMITDGITVVAAAGNETLTTCNVIPASVAGVISVAASDRVDKEAFFSNYGTCVDIFAPGVSILSASKGSNVAYAENSGTSMAAPHVVGVVARYLQGNPIATPQQVWDWMSANATYCAVTSYSQTRLNNSLSRLIQMDAAPGLPCEPQNVTLSMEGVGAVFNWTQPPGSNGSPLIESSVTLSAEIPKCVTTLTTCTFSGLVKGFEYSAVLVSKNSIGESKKVTLKFTPPGISAPTVPQTVAAVAAEKSATVSWTAPLSVNGSPITAYTVTLAPGGATCSTLELSCIFTGLLAGTTYTASVTATNAAGASVIATATVIPTAQPAAITKVRTVLGNQSIEIALIDGNTSETVYTASTQGGKSCVLDTILMLCKIKGLKNGKSYVFTLNGATSTVTVLSMFVTDSLVVGGIQEKITSMKRAKTNKLTQVITTQSTGKKTWRVIKGGCSLTATMLKASAKAGVCKLRVAVAKTSKFPQMQKTWAIAIE